MSDETLKHQEEATSALLTKLPSYEKLSRRLLTEDTGYERILVLGPELPEGVLEINSANLNIDAEVFEVWFTLSVGRVGLSLGNNIVESGGSHSVIAWALVYVPNAPRNEGEDNLFYGTLDPTLTPSLTPTFDKLSDATLTTVVDVLPRVVSFLNQFADGEVSQNVMELVVINTAQVPVVDRVPAIPADRENLYREEIKPLDSAVIIDHARRIFTTNAGLVKKTERDTRELVVKDEEEGAVYVYRAIGEGEEVSYSVALRTQTGCLTCVADSTNSYISYIFSTRGITKGLSFEALPTARYSHEFTWHSEMDGSLDESAFRGLKRELVPLFRSHIDTLHKHIEQLDS